MLTLNDPHSSGVTKITKESHCTFALNRPLLCSTMSSGPFILVTGGCGYIGSHTITYLLNSPLNYSVVVVDNLCNSSPISLDRVTEICGLDEQSRKDRLIFREVDMCDEAAFRKVFEELPQFSACIHFAGLKVRYLLVRLYLLSFVNCFIVS